MLCPFHHLRFLPPYSFHGPNLPLIGTGWGGPGPGPNFDLKLNTPSILPVSSVNFFLDCGSRMSIRGFSG